MGSHGYVPIKENVGKPVELFREGRVPNELRIPKIDSAATLDDHVKRRLAELAAEGVKLDFKAGRVGGPYSVIEVVIDYGGAL